MSLGFAKVAPADWDKLLKGGFGGDTVDVGDYIGNVTQLRHIEPEKNKKGLGAYIVVLELGTENAEEWQGKKVETRFGYHPDPDNSEKPDGYAKMNEISQQNIVQLIAASNAEPISTPDGMFDIIQTLSTLPDMRPSVAFSVTHRTDDNGREQQDVERFRPVVA
jgi:hypothetical protein